MTMKSGLVDIECGIRHNQAGRDSIAIATGETFTNKYGREAEKWFWLPRSQIEIYQGRSGTIVTLPEWLALEKGLI
jgi:hypothetical protein